MNYILYMNIIETPRHFLTYSIFIYYYSISLKYYKNTHHYVATVNTGPSWTGELIFHTRLRRLSDADF